MPAAASIGRRERVLALAAVALVQIVFGAALLIGLRVDVLRRNELVSRLVDITLTPPPPPPVPPSSQPQSARRLSAAPKAKTFRIGGSPGPKPSPATHAPTAIVALHPAAPEPGGGTGSGTAAGAGKSGGTGGQGTGGDGDGGADLVQIAGAIFPSDYPRDLRQRGLGGRVEMVFTVGTTGRVTSCTVTRSSGIPELDALTCRLIQQRFRYRPSTDRFGRPIVDEMEGDQEWVAKSL